MGGALLLVPGNIEKLRGELLAAITEEIWDQAATGFGDPDLASE